MGECEVFGSMLTPLPAEQGRQKLLTCSWRHRNGMPIEFERKKEFETFVHDAKRRKLTFQYGVSGWMPWLLSVNEPTCRLRSAWWPGPNRCSVGCLNHRTDVL